MGGGSWLLYGLNLGGPAAPPGPGGGYFPARYWAGRYFPGRYFPGPAGTAPAPPGPGAGYYHAPCFPGRYFPGRYFPGTAVAPAGPAAGPAPARRLALAWSVGTRPFLLWDTPMAVETDLEGFVGEDWIVTLTAVSPTDVTGWNCAFVLRNPYSGAVLATRSGSDVTIANVSAGVFTARVYAADLTLPPAWYDFSFDRVDPGASTVLAHGKFNLKAR
jgi:hypothetical protein